MMNLKKAQVRTATSFVDRSHAAINELTFLARTTKGVDIDQKVTEAAKHVVSAMTTSKITRNYLTIAAGILKNQQGFEKKHRFLYKILTDLNISQTRGFNALTRHLKLEGIELEFEKDVDKAMEAFELAEKTELDLTGLNPSQVDRLKKYLTRLKKENA